MKGSAFKQGGVQGTSGHKSALKQTSPMKDSAEQKMAKVEKSNAIKRKEGIEEEDIAAARKRAETHDKYYGSGHTHEKKEKGEETAPTTMKSPLEQGVDTAKMRQRSLEADEGISGRIRRFISGSPEVSDSEKEAALENYNEQVAKLNDAIEQGKVTRMKGAIGKLAPKIVGGMKEAAAEVSEFAKKQKE